nr:hypothetical protein [Tanacetum cinerariifolium]
MYLCRIILRYRCARTKLITPDVACPSTHQLLRNSGGDPEPDLSFDKSTFLERLSSLAHVSLAEASKPDLSIGWSERDYTSSYPLSLVSAKLACDWFSSAKRRAPSPVCIDDNLSCMKHWKSGLFFIHRRDIQDAMVWRHPDIAIDDPRPTAGSFNMADVRRLSAHVIKLRDMPEGVLVLSGLSRAWNSCVCNLLWAFMIFSAFLSGSVLRSRKSPILMLGRPFKGFPFTVLLPLRPMLLFWIPLRRILPLVPLVLRLLLMLKLLRSKRSLLLVSLRAMLLSALGLPWLNHLGTRVGVLLLPLLKVLTPEILKARELWLMNVSGAAIHTDFFPFFAGPYYATYPEDGVVGNCEFTREEGDAPYRPTFGVLTKEVFKDPAICKTIVDQFPTPGEMVWVESLSDDQLTTKMSVRHCMMMPHSGELLARYRGLNQSHHEYVLSTDSRLKGYEEKSKAKGNERKKKIKSLTKSVDNLHSEVARLFAALNQAIGLVWKFLASDEFSRAQGELLSLADSVGFERGLSMHQTKDEFAIFEHAIRPLSVILRLEPEKLVRPANVPASKKVRVSRPTKESTMTPASKSLELSYNVYFIASAISLEHNEEMGIFVALDDAVELLEVGSGHVSSDLNDVVVSFSASEKGDGLDPSFAVGEEVAANPSEV